TANPLGSATMTRSATTHRAAFITMLVAVVSVVCCGRQTAYAESITVHSYFENFDAANFGALGPEWSDASAGNGVANLFASNSAMQNLGFSGNVLRMYGDLAGVGYANTNTAFGAVRLTLTGLPEHD